MNREPLLFSFQRFIAGRGFIANVEIQGRALFRIEDEDWWLFGVQPGGIAAGGKTYGMALYEFRKGYTSVLFDIAFGAEDFQNFKEMVEEFFAQVNKPNLEDWQEIAAASCYENHLLPSVSVIEIKLAEIDPSQNKLDFVLLGEKIDG